MCLRIVFCSIIYPITSYRLKFLLPLPSSSSSTTFSASVFPLLLPFPSSSIFSVCSPVTMCVLFCFHFYLYIFIFFLNEYGDRDSIFDLTMYFVECFHGNFSYIYPFYRFLPFLCLYLYLLCFSYDYFLIYHNTSCVFFPREVNSVMFLLHIIAFYASHYSTRGRVYCVVFFLW